jgi:hypothetical protein
MTEFDRWLSEAVRQLSRESAARVRCEIQEHYESAREAALAEGASDEQADRLAVQALGDAKTVNCQYRNVLLTAEEAKLLRQSNCEARAIASRTWLKRLLVFLPVALMASGVVLLLAGSFDLARDLMIAGMGMSPLFAAVVFPIRTAARGLVFRRVKWIVMAGAVLLMFGENAGQWSWLLISCGWPVIHTEWKRAAIRRKLPVAAWPRQLYL